MKKYVDGVLVDLTDKEIEEFNQRLNSLPSSYETAIKNLRFKRTKLLQETDWMANSDVTMSDTWKIYRQELRDLPSTLNDTNVQQTITWPDEPS